MVEGNPRDPRCAKHLRRICGTCRHYTGPLWPNRQTPAAPESAVCDHFGTEKRCTTRADACRYWCRPDARKET